jgi:hypothetical protein
MGARLGGAPRPNQSVREKGHEFVVRQVRRGKVFEASVTRAADRPPTPAP